MVLSPPGAAFRVGGYLGLGLSLLVLFGLANVPILFVLWLLYMSFVHVGQLFYGYGWEILHARFEVLKDFRRILTLAHEYDPGDDFVVRWRHNVPV